MAKAPYFPFYVKDWLCSNRVLSMSGEAVKAYVYLLASSWLQEPRATLPKEREQLASLSRLTCDKWDAVSKEVLQHLKEGKCSEHKGRLYNDTLLEISRKWENNQRPNNKNAKRTRINHEVNTALDNDNAIENGINSFLLFKDSYPQKSRIGESESMYNEICTGVSPYVVIQAAKEYDYYCRLKYPDEYPQTSFIMLAYNWLKGGAWKTDWKKESEMIVKKQPDKQDGNAWKKQLE